MSAGPVRGPLIAVIGGSSCTREESDWAAAVGRLLAEHGAVLQCGGLGGVEQAEAAVQWALEQARRREV